MLRKIFLIILSIIFNSQGIPTRGNSTKTSITSNKPGSSSAPGIGIDVKHNSYARYLARLKSKSLGTQVNSAPKAIMGNKTKNYGLINSPNCFCKIKC